MLYIFFVLNSVGKPALSGEEAVVPKQERFPEYICKHECTCCATPEKGQKYPFLKSVIFTCPAQGSWVKNRPVVADNPGYIFRNPLR
jgi:hypothetical protein